MTNAASTTLQYAQLDDIADDEGFEIMPASIHTIEEDVIAGIRIEHIEPSSGIIFDLIKAETTALAWAMSLKKALAKSKIELIELDRHTVITHWMDEAGDWHLTLEGDMLFSMQDCERD